MEPIRRGLQWVAQEAGIRFLLRRRAASAVAILTVALALGANTAVFSVLRTFLLASIGVPDAGRLVVVGPHRELPGRGAVLFFDAYPNYELVRSIDGAFDAVACTFQGTANWDDRGEARPLQFARVTASFFATMKVNPIAGRAFEQREEGPSPAAVVIISHALWTATFVGDTAIIGKPMNINGAPHTIVGVMPRGFAQPAPTDIWLPFDIPVNARTTITGARSLTIFGRLSPSTTRERAVAIAGDLTKRTLGAHPVDNKDFRYELRPLRDVMLGNAGSSVVLVQIGAVALLVLAIVNLASLLVAWGFDRQQEMAVREALGASSGRLVRLLMAQSLFVVATGTVLGFAVTRLAVPWLRTLQINPQLTYFTQRIEFDSAVLVFGMVVAVASGLVAGVLPAWFSRRSNLSDALRSGSRTTTVPPAALRWQQGMVVLQAALSVVVISAAALIVVSFRNAARVPSGFDSGKAIVARLQFLSSASHPQRAAFMNAFEERMRQEPAIAAFGATSTLPVSDITTGGRFFIERPDPLTPPEAQQLHYRRITPGYLAAVNIPLLKGRNFDARDDSATRPVVIVSRAFATRVWPGEEAVGKQLYRVAGGIVDEFEVVGIVGDVMDAGNRAPPGEAAYVPWSKVSAPRVSVVFEPRGTRAEALAGFRNALRTTDPLLAPSAVASLADLAYQANALPRLQTLLLLIFGGVAVGITALGCYGVMSQVVANREREYALRLIFGAAPSELGRAVFVLLARLAIPGIVVGLGVILSLGGALRAFVFGVDPRSTVVLTAVSLGMACVTAIATWPSVVRAMRVDVTRSVGTA